jgi:hypothetical protein
LKGGATWGAAAAVMGTFANEFVARPRQEERGEAFMRGLCQQVGDHEGRLAAIEANTRGPDAEEAIVVAFQRASNAARLDKARTYGQIIGGTAVADAPNWQEAVQFIRDVEQFTDADVKALKRMWRFQRMSYQEMAGTLRTMSSDANEYTKDWRQVVDGAAKEGIARDDWYAECGRLTGFGLALPVQSNPSYQGPDAMCYRLTGRAVRLLALLGYNVDPRAYPAVRYHRDHEPRSVQDEDEDRALGEGWGNTPVG